MKNREYVRMIEASPNAETVRIVIITLFREMSDLSKARNISTNTGLSNVINETRKRWIAICTEINYKEVIPGCKLREESFDIVLSKLLSVSQ